MPTRRHDTKRLYDLLGIRPIGGGSGEGEGNGGTTEGQQPSAKPNGDDSTNAKPGGQQGETEFTPITSEAELKAWKDSVRKSIVEETRAQLAKEQADREAKEQAERERKEAEARGEFESVRASLEAERDTALAERDELKGIVAQYEAIAQTRLEALKAELNLPDEVMGSYPAEASVLDQLAWLEDRGAVWKAAQQAAGSTNNQKPRLPNTPEPNGDIKTDLRKSLQGIRYT